MGESGSVTIRQASAADAAAVADLWPASFESGAVVGFMSLHEDDLDHLYVRPDWFDHGVGSQFVELAKERRPGGLGLYTFQVNARAHGFYERRGFRAEWFGEGDSNEERQPDVRYVWMGVR